MKHSRPLLQGSCLCGAIQVHLASKPLLSLACHCRDCQKLSASAFTLTAMFPSDSFTYAGELAQGGLGATGRRHYFCKACLGFVYSQIDRAPQRINLRTSILDDAASYPPFVELMTCEKQPWANVPAPHSYARFPETPDALQALMTEYESWQPVP